MSKFDVDEMINDFIDGQELLRNIKGEYNKTKFSDQIRKINSELDILEEMMNKDYKILHEIKYNLQLLEEKYSIKNNKLTNNEKKRINILINNNLPEIGDGDLFLNKDNFIVLNKEVIGQIDYFYKNNVNYIRIKMNNKNNGEYREFPLNIKDRIYNVILYIFSSIYN